MFIKWLGHSCFELTSEEGVTLVIDPFDETTGYPMPKVCADAVLSTHDHFDHNYFAACPQAQRITGNVHTSLGGVCIDGYPSFHDKSQGAERGQNTVFTIEMDGVTVCHMGDIGHLPSAELYGELGRVDVLLIPVGGTFTVDAAEALEIIDNIRPNIIIPMHYLTPEIKSWAVAPIDDFLNRATGHYDISRTGKSTIEVTAGDLKKRTRIVVLEYF